MSLSSMPSALTAAMTLVIDSAAASRAALAVLRSMQDAEADRREVGDDGDLAAAGDGDGVLGRLVRGVIAAAYRGLGC